MNRRMVSCTLSFLTCANTELIHALEFQEGPHDRPQLRHLLTSVKAHQFLGDGPWCAAQQSPEIAQTERQSPRQIGLLRHPIGHPADFPDWMPAQIIVLLAI